MARVGFVPMALSTGTGAELQQPLAIALIGEIVTSTILTLVALPALYGMSKRLSEPAVGGGSGTAGARTSLALAKVLRATLPPMPM